MNESPPSGGRIVVFVVALVAVVGLAFWLLAPGSDGSRDAAGDERPEPTRAVDPSVSAMVPDANLAAVGDCVATWWSVAPPRPGTRSRTTT